MITLWCHAKHMFPMILLSVTKTFQKRLVLKMSKPGFMVNKHSKNINKTQFKLQLNLALQRDIFQKVLFLEKDSCTLYFKNGILGTFVAYWGQNYDSYHAKYFLADFATFS